MKKYEAICHEIIGQIESGKLPPDSLLPSEHELMETFQASRDTIRKALTLLIENGYIQKSQGRRSVVLDMKRFKLPISNIESMKEVGKSLGEGITTKVLFLQKIHPDRSVAKKLQLTFDDYVWMIVRVRYFSSEAIILDTDFVNAALVPDLTKEICEDSLYEYIEGTLGKRISYADKIITCQHVNTFDKQYLDLKDYDMVVDVESYTYLEPSIIFQYTASRHRPDKFRFEDRARRLHNPK